MTTSSARTIRSLASRSVVIVVWVFASLGVLASFVYGALAQSTISGSGNTVEVGLVGPDDGVPDLPMPDMAYLAHSTISIHVMPGETPAEPLLRASDLLPYVVGGPTCLVIVVLAVQLLRRRPLGLLSGVSMIGLGLLTIACGFAAPALSGQAAVMVVEQLGLPSDGEGHEFWVVPGGPDWTDSDWTMIVLGLLTALGG